MARKVFEITLFWSEKTIFKERIQTALEYAEVLYVAEGNESHSGKIKRPFLIPSLIAELDDNHKRRVVHVPVDFTNHSEKNPFAREKIVRDAALTELLKNPLFNPSSILIIQDFDEFISPAMANAIELELYGWKFWRSSVRLKQRLSIFKLNLQDIHDWSLSLAVTGSLARSVGFSPNEWRHRLAKKRSALTHHYFGWHHSYLGDAEFIRNKLESFAEASLTMVKNVTDQTINDSLANGRDLFGRDIQLNKIDYSKLEPIPALLSRKDLISS